MTQDRQIKKVKLYRTLRIAFYILGLPMFMLAVFLSAIKFIGNDPFTGTSVGTTQLGFFQDMEILLSSPALHGVWIAFAIWFVLVVVHIILSKVVKNRRTRMFSMLAVTLVVMLGTMFVMDAVLGAKVEEIAKNAPSGVVVEDYKTQLSYYRTISSKRHAKNMTENLIAQVELLEKVYGVEMEGIDKSGSAGNIGNKPVTYGNVIDDKGNVGVDISFVTDSKTGLPKLNYNPSAGNQFTGGDGNPVGEIEKNQVIRLAPNKDGVLVINSEKYTHYYYIERKSTDGTSLYTWYAKDLLPKGYEASKGAVKMHTSDGKYGTGLYNESGLLSDGWVFSLENAINILEEYYLAKEAIDKLEPAEIGFDYNEMYEYAEYRRDAYYMGEIPDENGEYVDKWLSALYQQEKDMGTRFSLTREELDELVAKLGALIGNNALFDYIFANLDTTIGDIVGEFGYGGLLDWLDFSQFAKGISLSTFGLEGGTLNTVAGVIKDLIGKPDLDVDDLYLTVAYKSDDAFGRRQDHLYVALVRGVGNWTYADKTELALERRDGKWYWVVPPVAFNYVDVIGNSYEQVRGREIVLAEDGNSWTYVDDESTVPVQKVEDKWFYTAEDGEEPVEFVYIVDGNKTYELSAVREIVLAEDGNSWTYAEDGSEVPAVKNGNKWYYTAEEGEDSVEFLIVKDEDKQFEVFDREVVLAADGNSWKYADDDSAVPVQKVEDKWFYTAEDGEEAVEFTAVEKGDKKYERTMGKEGVFNESARTWTYAEDESVVSLTRTDGQWYFVEEPVEFRYIQEGDKYYAIENIVREVAYNEQDNLWYAGGGALPLFEQDGKWYYTAAEGEEPVEFRYIEDGDKKYEITLGKEIVFNTVIGTNPAEDVLIDIDFSDYIIDEKNGTYAFDFDTLSDFLNKGINNMLEKYNIDLNSGIIKTVLGLFLKEINVDGQTYTGLIISGINIPLLNESGKFDIDINGILDGLLKTMYCYQSPVIKPIWEFYVNPELIAEEGYESIVEAQRDYMNYERSQYLAKIQGGIIGSVLLGDKLGGGTYTSDFGLNDLQSVQQLKTDLSYKPNFFPLYALRDMLAFFTGTVLLFYFFSYVAAQREEDYAHGKLTVRTRKGRKKDAKVIAEFDGEELANAANEENADGAENAETEDTASAQDNEEGAEEPSREKKHKEKRWGKKKKQAGEEYSEEDTDTLVDEESDEEVL